MYMDHRVGMYWWYWSRVTLDVSSDRIGGRISSLDDPLIYLLCIIGPLRPSKNSKNIMEETTWQGLQSLYTHT